LKIIKKIGAVILPAMFLVLLPILAGEWGLALAGVAVLAYTVWGVRNGKRGS